jgi:hypothetical protein
MTSANLMWIVILAGLGVSVAAFLSEYLSWRHCESAETDRLTALKNLYAKGTRISMYAYVALRGPTCLENSHANHTWY